MSLSRRVAFLCVSLLTVSAAAVGPSPSPAQALDTHTAMLRGQAAKPEAIPAFESASGFLQTVGHRSLPEIVPIATESDALTSCTPPITPPLPDFPDFPYNVRRYGAVGDGVTDDTASIQCAIDAAEVYAASIAGSGANGGAVVYFPGGNYLISQTLTVEQHSVSLQGAGVRTTSITRSSAFSAGDTIVVRNPTAGRFMFGNSISAMRLRATAETFSGAHIHLISCIYATYTDLLLEEQYGGLLLEGGLELQFNNTSIAADSFFPSLKSGSYFVKLAPVTGNTVAPFPIEIFFANASWNTAGGRGTVEFGLKVHAADAIYFTNIHVLGAGLANVFVSPGPLDQVTALRFSNSYFDATFAPPGGGIASVFIDGQTSKPFGAFGFNNCSFWGGGGTGSSGPNWTHDGIMVNSGSNVKGVSITNNVIAGYAYHGAHLAGGSNIVIANNQISNNNTAGVFGVGVLVQPGVSDFHITNNLFGASMGGSTQQHSYSVYVQPGASNRYLITGNSMLNNIAASIVDAGTGPKKLVNNNLTQ